MVGPRLYVTNEEDWGDLGVTAGDQLHGVWSEDKKEKLHQAIIKVRELEGFDDI